MQKKFSDMTPEEYQQYVDKYFNPDTRGFGPDDKEGCGGDIKEDTDERN